MQGLLEYTDKLTYLSPVPPLATAAVLPGLPVYPAYLWRKWKNARTNTSLNPYAHMHNAGKNRYECICYARTQDRVACIGRPLTVAKIHIFLGLWVFSTHVHAQTKYSHRHERIAHLCTITQHRCTYTRVILQPRILYYAPYIHTPP